MADRHISTAIPLPPPPPPTPKPWSLPSELDEEEDPFKEKRAQKELQFLMVGAIEKGDSSALVRYIQSGVYPNAKIQLVKTPLTLAIEQDEISSDIVLTLLQGQANPNLSDFTPRGTCPLHILAHKDDVKTADMVINLSNGIKCDLEIKDNAGCTPLHYAARYGNTRMVDYLLKQGVDIHARDSVGCSALHRACESLHYTTAEFLLVNGHDINVEDTFGWTPLFHSVFFNNIEMVKLLLKHGADLSTLDWRNNSLLSAVFYLGDICVNFSPVLRIVSTSFDYYHRTWAIPPKELQVYLLSEELYRGSPDGSYVMQGRLELLRLIINAGMDPSLYPEYEAELYDFKEFTYMMLYLNLAGAIISGDEQRRLTDLMHGYLKPSGRSLGPVLCFQDHVNEQYSLLRQCRNTIRKTLASTRDINGAVGQLPVPSPLKGYLRLEEFDNLLTEYQ